MTGKAYPRASRRRTRSNAKAANAQPNGQLGVNVGMSISDLPGCFEQAIRQKNQDAVSCQRIAPLGGKG